MGRRTRHTNQDIRNWIRNIEQHASDNVNKILVGNKADMDESKRAVPTSKGQALADEYGIKFFETSAKTNLNVEQVFFSIARDIKQRLADTDSRAEAYRTSQEPSVLKLKEPALDVPIDVPMILHLSSSIPMDGKTELQILSFQSPKIRLLRSLCVEGNEAMQVLSSGTIHFIYLNTSFWIAVPYHVALAHLALDIQTCQPIVKSTSL
ncbi:hypothetical protein TEA_029677 [Camellia sinensis var. sinensis]|uniref:Uncharacterized protein n=1 Tax=Camellia sinensis var. sinensis TaxID=542762 RepID=A0A4S4EGI6_CAMSN|nr:hypothetical protein TEA_029677 [Camellia sinensis var. sinensis]